MALLAPSYVPLALVGNPVGHSLSPLIHRTALAAARLEGGYVGCPVLPRYLRDAVKGLAALGFRGANVTIPHKETVLPYCDALSPTAQEIGAVNTLSFARDGTVTGDNTDAAGFAAPLLPLKDRLEGRAATVLGAGGSARAVLFALKDAPAMGRVHLVARRIEQAEQLAEHVGGSIECHPWAERDLVARRSDLIVNTTPIGMAPGTEKSPLSTGVAVEDQIVYDLVYRPGWTQLLRESAHSGAEVLGGLEMLIQQAAAAFWIWTGHRMDLDQVRAALSDAGIQPVNDAHPPATEQ